MKLPFENQVESRRDRIEEVAKISQTVRDARVVLLLTLGFGAFLVYMGVAGVATTVFLNAVGIGATPEFLIAYGSMIQTGLNAIIVLGVILAFLGRKKK